MSRVSEDEVLLLWRALRAFRSGKKPPPAPRRWFTSTGVVYGS